MRPENMKEIMMAAPESYELNRKSRDTASASDKIYSLPFSSKA